MKPHPRIRKTIKWGGAAVTVLLIAVWLASPWWTFVLVRGNYVVALDRGRVNFIDQSVVYPPQHQQPNMLIAGLRPAGAGVWRWWFDRGQIGGFVCVPVWVFAVVFVPVTAIAWWMDARARLRERVGVCPKCNYDRVGLAVGAKCPECGHAG